MARHLGVIVGLTGIVALLAACSAAASPSSSHKEPPTVAAFFEPSRGTALPTATRLPSPTRRPTRTPDPVATPTPPPRHLVDLVIYDDALDPDWSVDNSWDVRVEMTSTNHVYTRTVAMAVTPLQDYGAVFFTVRMDARRSYSTADVLGVALWLSGGDGELMPDDLAVSFAGSNEFAYWLRGDTSVQSTDLKPFSETRLRYLGFDNALAPGGWKETVARIDKLLYEPHYDYLTGFYIKSDRDIRQTYYIDRVSLLVLQP
jgi:hypothetical protein